MRRKLLAVVLLILIVFHAMPLTVSADDPVTRDTVLLLDDSSSLLGPARANLKIAAKSFCQFVTRSSGINRVAVVFYSDTIEAHDFTDNINDLNNIINNMPYGNNTDINAAVKKADELLQASTAKIKNILLMTDGLPNTGDRSTTGRYKYEDSHNYYDYANALYDTAVALHDDYNIYTFGFFQSISSSNKPFAVRLLKDIQNAGYYEADDPRDLEELFKEIAQKIADDDGEEHDDSVNYSVRVFFFPLPILPPNFNHSNLNFSTNGGAAIDPITLPTGTTVQLSQYIPLRDGYEFVGWCRDEALTRTITKVQVIDPNTVVYAKWSPVG